MTQMVTIRDETVGGDTDHQFELELLSERLTVRELIRSRVYQEVKDYNVRRQQDDSAAPFRGLVQPTGAEATSAGYHLRKQRQIDWQQQFDRAIEAFQANQILLLVDDRQVESLEEELEIGSDTVVSFLRLTPLVGG